MSFGLADIQDIKAVIRFRNEQIRSLPKSDLPRDAISLSGLFGVAMTVPGERQVIRFSSDLSFATLPETLYYAVRSNLWSEWAMDVNRSDRLRSKHMQG